MVDEPLKIREIFGSRREWLVGPGLDLSGANFRGVCLAGVNLRGANCSDVVLNGADLSGACLDNASFRGAVLYKAVLESASALSCDFRGAILREANICGANLSGALLDDDATTEAYGDEETQLPPGFRCKTYNQSIESDFGSEDWGGYRRLRRRLSDGAPPQPFLPVGVETIRFIDGDLQSDLRSALSRVLFEESDAQGIFSERPSDEGWFGDDDVPQLVAAWYADEIIEDLQPGGTPETLAEIPAGLTEGPPLANHTLADFICGVLDPTFEEVHSDGSVTAILDLSTDAKQVLLSKVFVPEYLELNQIEFDDTNIVEVDLTVVSMSQFFVEFDELMSEPIDQNTIHRFWLKPKKRKALLITCDYTSETGLVLTVPAGSHAALVLDHLRSHSDEEPEVVELDRGLLGWSTTWEMTSNDDEMGESLTELIEEVREHIEPISISSFGQIIGYETWEHDVAMTRIRLWNPEELEAGGSFAHESLSGRELLRAYLDEALSAYAFSGPLTFDDDDNDDSASDDHAEDEEIDDEEDEIDDIVDEEVINDDDDEVDLDDADAFDDEETDDFYEDFKLQIELASVLMKLREQGKRIDLISDAPAVDFDGNAISAEEIVLGWSLPRGGVSEHRWRQMIAAAHDGVVYLRSLNFVESALGLLQVEQLSNHRFRVKMRPSVSKRYRYNYEWVPPSRWRLQEAE
ncbi:MAG: pentapeptide repeat-containing protein [Micrococcales bacterium]|nr:pentapeptide repeat-containing protein [Micrococcales bacterium]